MAQFNCSKCDSQGLEWKEGISKKNGKPWKAWNCPDCKLMHGMDGKPWGDMAKPAFVPQGGFNATRTATQGPSSTDKKLDLILDILKREFPNANDDVEVPF